jgi:hypothetical protein
MVIRLVKDFRELVKLGLKRWGRKRGRWVEEELWGL